MQRLLPPTRTDEMIAVGVHLQGERPLWQALGHDLMNTGAESAVRPVPFGARRAYRPAAWPPTRKTPWLILLIPSSSSRAWKRRCATQRPGTAIASDSFHTSAGTSAPMTTSSPSQP